MTNLTKFTLSIDLDKGAQWQDIRDNLREAMASVGGRLNSHPTPTGGDGGNLHDDDGNWIGYWHVDGGA